MNHRLHSLCPYFAMFPPAFARDNVLAHTLPGHLVCDPFSGRGTTLLEALLNHRRAIASDINPVAYCVSAAKAHTPSLPEVYWELDGFESKYSRCSLTKIEKDRLGLPIFFRRAFHAHTLRQLLFLRSHLQWRGNPVHRFLAALVLGHLHGEANRSPNYLSNQMPHSISLKPAYSLGYWRRKNLWAPRHDVFEFLRERAEFRLEHDPPAKRGKVALCDVRNAGRVFRRYLGQVDAVITSPPYLDTTRFEEDQWLRLWFLGSSPKPTYGQISSDDRHTSIAEYISFLKEGWAGIRILLRRTATIVLRIGSKDLDHATIVQLTTDSLKAVWPNIALVRDPIPTILRNSQARTLTPNAVGCRFETDLVYSLC